MIWSKAPDQCSKCCHIKSWCYWHLIAKITQGSYSLHEQNTRAFNSFLSTLNMFSIKLLVNSITRMMLQVENGLMLQNVLNYITTNTHSHLIHTVQSCVQRIMRFTYLPWFALGGHTWTGGTDEFTLGPCLAWLRASLCRLADSCHCCMLPCEKAWRPRSECWPYVLMVNTSQMPNKQKQTKRRGPILSL